jgi:hypothetical protein
LAAFGVGRKTMAVTAKVYGLLFSSMANKEVDLNSDTIKCSLHTSSYTPNQDTHQYWDVNVTNEVSGTGYTAGGAIISSPTFALDGASNTWKFDGNDVSWPSNSTTSRTAVIYDSSPASNKPTIAYVDFGEDLVPLSITWHANGIFTITVA